MEFIVNYDIKILQTLNELSKQIAEILKNEVNLVKDNFNLVLSGGNTPKHILKYLSDHYQTKIEWNKINFFWGDERCVPPNDSESNYKMAYESLLSKLSIPEKNIFRIKGEENPVDEANRYSELIKKIIPQKDQLPQFDLIMLGLGEDGHTASIFQNQKGLLNSDKIYTTAVHPLSGQTRITLTGRVINNALTVLFIAAGKNKKKIVDEIINQKENYKDYPASSVNPKNGVLYWFLDKEAASQIEPLRNEVR
jgi:6-phosphogluconolactonase